MNLDLTKCCNCGKEFSKQKKSYGRRSLGASAKLKKIDKTLKDIIEEEFTVQITPDSKNQRFLCESCSWMLVSMAKSSVAKQEALERLKGSTGGTTYLAKKLRSPVPTPRKIKRLRTASPQKVNSL
ncbi:hypothetical protein DPMN_035370 [Dreissena polymorpha]|uniref:Uncharacterized protein n=1 Tax=Dreissena polymorpha TaxID=45954 RepID=A0A9D4MBR7_DREPO|nr:hypothetical protein DPMN_035370 [Dreissena polymorpha]